MKPPCEKYAPEDLEQDDCCNHCWLMGQHADAARAGESAALERVAELEAQNARWQSDANAWASEYGTMQECLREELRTAGKLRAVLDGILWWYDEHAEGDRDPSRALIDEARDLLKEAT